MLRLLHPVLPVVLQGQLLARQNPAPGLGCLGECHDGPGRSNAMAGFRPTEGQSGSQDRCRGTPGRGRRTGRRQWVGDIHAREAGTWRPAPDEPPQCSGWRQGIVVPVLARWLLHSRKLVSMRSKNRSWEAQLSSRMAVRSAVRRSLSFANAACEREAMAAPVDRAARCDLVASSRS